MRIVVAILSASIVLGLTWIYQQTLAENQLPTVEAEPVEIRDTYRLRVVATFDAGIDPFAEDVSSAAALKVSLLGQSVVAIDQPIPAGQPVDTSVELDLRQGINEFLIEMTPANTSDLVPKAIHVELYRGSDLQPLESQTIWAEAAETKLVGRVPFQVNVAAASAEETE
ncbi:hypothetical protein AB1K70_24750 [Bremerella sp. JC770]|uniref:hypothetical protein n=1 Tax=Bremerella sp. JC770 TaxID=3232137 RepID=UPI00345803C8